VGQPGPVEIKPGPRGRAVEPNEKRAPNIARQGYVEHARAVAEVGIGDIIANHAVSGRLREIEVGACWCHEVLIEHHAGAPGILPNVGAEAGARRPVPPAMLPAPSIV
jgi:hypothetical protein